MPEEAGKSPWVLVSPGFHRHGGMEKANFALGDFLAHRGTPVHLVGHSMDAELSGRSGVSSHVVSRPAASFLLGERRIDRRGREVARAVSTTSRGARVVVNGGNCGWDDVNWVHFVHHAWSPTHQRAPLWFRLKTRLLSVAARSDELRRIPKARMVLANSAMTRRHLIELIGVDPSRVHTQYLGAEATWGLVSGSERDAARERLGIPHGRPVVVFIGALGYDTRKGFDVLLSAWARLCARGGWDAQLIAAGGGRGSARWARELEVMGLGDRVRLLGFTDRVAELLGAADLLVSPARYEPYGLNVQEALCRGLPALVSGQAGIAERYPEELQDLVLRDPEDVEELVRRLVEWRRDPESFRVRVQPFGELLRSYSWENMARDIVERVEGHRE